MGEDKRPLSGTFERVFHASLLLLGAAIALNLAIAFVRPLLPWIVGGVIIAGVLWTTLVFIRWRRSKW